jgi:hypothetical protein
MDEQFGLEAVMPCLEPYLAEIDGVIRDGFARLWTYDPAVLADYDDAAAAKCIHRHVIMLARQRLDPKPGVNVINVQRLEIVDFHGQACVRFKKVNGAGRGRNIVTLQQRRFDRQLPLLGLPPAAVHLVAGYKTNAANSEIEKVLIACPMGSTTLWTVQVVLSQQSKWEDITPLRFPGTERYRRPDEGDAASDNAGR